MKPERIREIAHDVTEYAERMGYPHPKSEDEIVADIMKAFCTGGLEDVNYLFDYIDCDDEMWDEVAEIWAADY